MQDGWYQFWSSYWWLIFPLFWMGMSVWRASQRHARANRTLDMIKSYADQGKEPPPELIRAMNGPIGRGDCGPGYGVGGDCGPGSDWRGSPARRWRNVILFGALTVGFAVLDFWPGLYDDTQRHYHHHLLIVVVIMAALCLSNLVGALMGGDRRIS